jgi:mRNA-degrading endonuclease YafQ of YafQ-DinJ toxin-antitoxin module
MHVRRTRKLGGRATKWACHIGSKLGLIYRVDARDAITRFVGCVVVREGAKY